MTPERFARAELRNERELQAKFDRENDKQFPPLEYCLACGVSPSPCMEMMNRWRPE